MKKVIATVTIAMLIPCLLTGCIKKAEPAKETSQSGKRSMRSVEIERIVRLSSIRKTRPFNMGRSSNLHVSYVVVSSQSHDA